MVVGLSGGVDSTALLVLAAVIAQRESTLALLHAMYVHHHLRAEADDEVIHCQNLCDALGVPFTTTHVHPIAAGHGLAAAARRLRHRALIAGAQHVGAKFILLGHHSDDVLETLLMRLGRGIALRGLSTIPWRRRADPASEIVIGRPLLCASRAQLVQFCTACGVTWREDSSNANVKSARGFLRATVVEELRSRWPAIAQHAVHASDAARSGEWALSQIANRDGWCAQEISRAQFRARGAVLAFALLTSALRAGKVELSPRTVRAVVDAACDDEQRPRSFQEASVVVTVNARGVRVATRECRAP